MLQELLTKNFIIKLMNLHNDLIRQYDYVFKRLQNISVLAFFDITIKYKRTTLGPIWNVLALLLTKQLHQLVLFLLLYV